ncbi:MAG: TIGR02302 family protein [Rhodospirillales bacterium]|nr:TIGR02302 family protein [Alphaproteobacteria bacterium]MBL6948065.1 TIGR02302 family protein [Rhodospirillales bacterium]
MNNPSPPGLLAPPPNTGEGAWQNRYRLFLKLARAALTWERLWSRVWPAVGLAAVFLAVALMDWLPKLPFWLHSLILIGFAAALGFMVRGALAGFQAANEGDARHRLERDSHLEHRPLTALNDRLADGVETPVAKKLWQAHLVRMAEAVGSLRLAWPSPGLSKLDPYGFRAVALLVLVIGLGTAGSDAIGRLERALVPKMNAGLSGPFELNIWITPPAYTGMAPIFLEGSVSPAIEPGAVAVSSKGQEAIRVPVGSSVLAQATAAGGAPVLVLGTRTIQFAEIGASESASGNGDAPGTSYRLQAVLGDADATVESLEVRLDRRPIARWPVTVVADGPPRVEFLRAPARAGRAQLRLDYEALDDYGLAGLQVVIRHPDGLAVPGARSMGDDGTAIRAELALPGLGSKKIQGQTLKDFSAHPWAGLVVEVRLQALDARGQAGTSDAVRVVLPERVFNHPVARAIAGARKMLNKADPEVINSVVGILDNLASRPQHFFDDTVVFLALSVAASRLIHDGTDAGIGAVQTLLWETALRIEDGEFAVAERDVRKLQERLQQALKNGKDMAEIERLMNELRQALDKYMQSLSEHLQQQGLTQVPLDPNSPTMDSADLQNMIDEARELAKLGSMDAARQMLSNLQRMLDNIKNGIQQGQPNKEIAKARRLMDNLRNLTRRQQQELEKTYKRYRQEPSRNRPKTGKGPQGRKGEKTPGVGEQQQLRQDLGRLMLDMDDLMGGIPKTFGQAEQAMKGAIKALRGGKGRKAVQAQTRALDLLRQGVGKMGESMARRLGGMFALQPGQRGQRSGPGSDPFGRRPGGAMGTSVNENGIKVPNQSERRRARDLLDELRRRAGERHRPVPERNYIDRLLKRF